MANLSNINGKFVVEQTTGYVGVGTTDPNYPIEVLNASAEIALNASGGSIYRVQSDSASNFIIRKEGVGDRLVINSGGNATFSGNVGINTAATNATLIVTGNVTDDWAGRFENTNAGGYGILAKINSTSSGDYIFQARTGTTNVMTILGSGNVGIGDTTPSFPLVISKSSSTASNGSDVSMRLGLSNPDQTNNNYALITFGDGTTQPGSGFFGMQFTDHTNNYGDLCFGTRGATGYGEKMRITSGGNVGIGTTSPDQQLDVAKSAIIGSESVISSTTNSENMLIVKGKNNYSDGTTWYGNYGQILLDVSSNMTGSAKKFLITNALDNNKFAIVRSDFNATPTVNSTGTGVNIGTADFVIDSSGKVGIGATSPRDKLTVFTAGSAEEEIGLRLVNPVGFTNSGSGASIIFAQDRSQTENLPMAKIGSRQTIAGTSSFGDLAFSCLNSTMKDTMIITAGGDVQIPTDSASIQLRSSGSGSYTSIRRNAANQLIVANTAGNQVFAIGNGGELNITNGASYSGTETYSIAWTQTYQTLILGSQLAPSSVYIITINVGGGFGTPPYYASAVFTIITTPGTNGGGGGNANIAPTSTHVNSSVFWQYRLSTIANGRNGVEAFLVNGPTNPPNNPTIYVNATKIM